jgi:hypothetical protein
MEETRNFEVDRENFLVVLEQALAPISAVLDGVARKFDLTANGPRDQYSAHDGPLDSWSMFTIMRQFQLIGIAVQELDVLVDRERALAGHRRYWQEVRRPDTGPAFEKALPHTHVVVDRAAAYDAVLQREQKRAGLPTTTSFDEMLEDDAYAD